MKREMTAFGSLSSTFLHCKILYSSTCFSCNLRNLFFIVLQISGGMLKKTVAQQEHLLWELLDFLKGRCFLPFFNLSCIDLILENPRQKLNITSKWFLHSFYTKQSLPSDFSSAAVITRHWCFQHQRWSVRTAEAEGLHCSTWRKLFTESLVLRFGH